MIKLSYNQFKYFAVNSLKQQNIHDVIFCASFFAIAPILTKCLTILTLLYALQTYCVDSQIPDSACTATAYLCGVKANRGTLGVTAEVPRWDCPASVDTSSHLESIAAWALADGRDAGKLF